MATLHLMIGLPCSGKTTYARALEQETHALLLTPDVWHLQLFGQDVYDAGHDQHHTCVEHIMWDVAKRVLTLGVDVILDFGFWARSEREDFRQRAKELGANFRLHYMDVPKEELMRRLKRRNEQLPDGVFVIPEAFMEQYMEIFQQPTPDELT